MTLDVCSAGNQNHQTRLRCSREPHPMACHLRVCPHELDIARSPQFPAVGGPVTCATSKRWKLALSEPGLRRRPGDRPTHCGDAGELAKSFAPLAQDLTPGVQASGDGSPVWVQAAGGGSVAVGHLCSQEAAQNRIARKALSPPLLSSLLTQFGNFAQKSLLNLRLHFDAVEFFLVLHGVTTSRGV